MVNRENVQWWSGMCEVECQQLSNYFQGPLNRKETMLGAVNLPNNMWIMRPWILEKDLWPPFPWTNPISTWMYIHWWAYILGFIKEASFFSAEGGHHIKPPLIKMQQTSDWNARSQRLCKHLGGGIRKMIWNMGSGPLVQDRLLTVTGKLHPSNTNSVATYTKH